jgi:hypothetical protein
MSADPISRFFEEVEIEPSAAFGRTLLADLHRVYEHELLVGGTDAQSLVELPPAPATRSHQARRPHRRWIAVAAVAAAVVAAIAIGTRDEDDDAPAELVETPETVAPRLDATLLTAPALGTEAPPVDGTATVVAVADLGPGGFSINGPFVGAFGAEGLWVTAMVPGDGQLPEWTALRLDPSTLEVIARVPIPGQRPYDRQTVGIVVAGGSVWVPALGEGLLRVDAATNSAVETVPVPGGVQGDAITAAGDTVWLAGEDHVLRRLDASTGEITATAPVPEMGADSSADLAIDGDELWVVTAAPDGRHVLGFDADDLEIRQHFLVPVVGGGEPWPFDVGAVDGTLVLTEHNDAGGITVIDTRSATIVRQDALGTPEQLYRGPATSVEGEVVWFGGGNRATAIRAGDAAYVRSISLPAESQQIVPLGGGLYLAMDWVNGGVLLLRFP